MQRENVSYSKQMMSQLHEYHDWDVLTPLMLKAKVSHVSLSLIGFNSTL